MLKLARIKAGSHLYGLNNAASDEDWYDIVALSPAETQWGAVSIAQGSEVGPGEVDQHEIDIASLVTGRMDTMWAIELLFAEPEGEVAPEWNRLRDIKKMLCTTTLVSQIMFRLQNTISHYAKYVPPVDDQAGQYVVKEGFSTKPVHSRNLAHAYRMAVQTMNYIVTRNPFATEFKLDVEAYRRLKENVVTVEDVRTCLETLAGVQRMRNDKVGISDEYYDSFERYNLAWDIINTTTVAAIKQEVSARVAYDEANAHI